MSTFSMPSSTLPYPTSGLADAPLQWRTLAALTLAVILAHWVLLGGLAPFVSGWQADHSSLSSGAFITRTIDAPPAPAPASKITPSPAVPKPREKTPSAPKVAEVLEKIPVEEAPPLAETPPDPTPSSDGNGSGAVYSAAALATENTPMALVIPNPARLKYDIKGEVKGFPYSANAELLWTHDGSNYDARMEIRHFLLGSRVQTSKGTLTALGLEPIRFGDKVRSEVAAHFERDKGKVSFSANTPDVPLTPGAQDNLSVFMQLAAYLGANSGRFPSGTTMSFQTIGPRSAETWVFKIGLPETLKLPGGDVLAIKLTRDAVNENDARAELWLAPSLGYLPARIRLSQTNGDFVDQLWRSTQIP